MFTRQTHSIPAPAAASAAATTTVAAATSSAAFAARPLEARCPGFPRGTVYYGCCVFRCTGVGIDVISLFVFVVLVKLFLLALAKKHVRLTVKTRATAAFFKRLRWDSLTNEIGWHGSSVVSSFVSEGWGGLGGLGGGEGAKIEARAMAALTVFRVRREGGRAFVLRFGEGDLEVEGEGEREGEREGEGDGEADGEVEGEGEREGEREGEGEHAFVLRFGVGEGEREGERPFVLHFGDAEREGGRECRFGSGVGERERAMAFRFGWGEGLRVGGGEWDLRCLKLGRGDGERDLLLTSCAPVFGSASAGRASFRVIGFVSALGGAEASANASA
ncbi:hypothetical protein T492DRAFT_1149788 [Pavlovales sp. CCMP2436]|nr:hypothetical protein T492DRAFT_1149788 [Pavlovales sp. CCMP2436]